MTRPKRKRIVTQPPIMEGFKPFGIPISTIEPVILLYEEYEAIRLLDYSGMTQAEAAVVMAVSRPTLTRIYEKARQTIAEAMVEGKAIIIEGGTFHTDEFWYRCESCFKLSISKQAMKACAYCHSDKIRHLTHAQVRINEEKMQEAGGFCICIECNTKIPHEEGVPCRDRSCPQCGHKMMRENSYHHQLYKKKRGENHENRDSQ